MAEIATLPVRAVLSAARLKCEQCGRRRPHDRRKWCLPCILQWQRDPGRQRALYASRVVDPCPRWETEVPERYRKADLPDLSETLVEMFLALPEDRGIYLWGRPGVGKTHAMAAFAKYLWSQGWSLRRQTYEMLCLSIRHTYKPASGQSELDILGPATTVPKLVIEDIGVTVSLGRQESDFSLRIFETILDQRLERGLATFLTGNKSPEELGRSFDARVASRLCQACEIIELTGPDRRLHQPDERD